MMYPAFFIVWLLAGKRCSDLQLAPRYLMGTDIGNFEPIDCSIYCIFLRSQLQECWQRCFSPKNPGHFKILEGGGEKKKKRFFRGPARGGGPFGASYSWASSRRSVHLTALNILLYLFSLVCSEHIAPCSGHWPQGR